MDKTYESISDFVKKFERETIPTNPSYAPNQKKVVELIDHYWVSRFKDGDNDTTGMKKSFFNVVTNPTEIAQKMIDVDTKDIKIVPEDGDSYWPAWLMEKSLRKWIKNKRNKEGQTFGQFLNTLVYNWPKYGHVLVKKAKDTVHLVPLQNVVNKQDAKSILASDLIVEQHDYTKYQMLNQGWDKDKVERIIEKYINKDVVTVYECHGDIGRDSNYIIIPKNCKDENDILFETNIDREEIYKELKWDDIPGRALGRGQVEKLFENQIAKNQTENMFRAGLRWSSKRIFQSRDETLARNLITQVDNGDILTALSEITPIAMEERNLAAYNWSDQKWDANTQNNTFSYPTMAGQRPPAGVAMGTNILTTQMASDFFELKQEELGMFIKGIIDDWLKKEFLKQTDNVLSKEDFLGEEEMNKLKKMLADYNTKEAFVKTFAKTMRVPTKEQMEVMGAMEVEKMKDAKIFKMPDNLYNYVNGHTEVVITSEQIDIASRLTTLQTMMQIIGSNPTILREPRIRKVFYQMISLAGFSPTDFEVEEEDMGMQDMMANQAQIGGSIARPTTPSTQPISQVMQQRI